MPETRAIRTDIELACGNVVLSAVETRAFRESGDGVLADRVRGGVYERMSARAETRARSLSATHLASAHRPRYLNTRQRSFSSEPGTAIMAHLPLLIILPPCGCCAFIIRVAYCVQSTAAVTLISMTDRKSWMSRSSSGMALPEMPAF